MTNKKSTVIGDVSLMSGKNLMAAGSNALILVAVPR